MKLTREVEQQIEQELQEAIADGHDVQQWTPEAVEHFLLRPGQVGEQFEFNRGDMIETIKDWQRKYPPA